MTAVVNSSTSLNGTKVAKVDIDCEQCGLVKSKYTCPKCSFRSCSLPCVKLHKESDKCDGKRPNFDPVKKISQYDDDTSIKDKMFLTGVTDGVVTGVKRANKIAEPGVVKEKIRKVENDVPKAEEVVVKSEVNVEPVEICEDENPLVIDDAEEETDPQPTVESSNSVNVSPEKQPTQPDEREERAASEECDFVKKYSATVENGFEQGLSRIEQSLISNVLRRRIFIKIENTADAEGSSYEPISNTIFWSIGLHFLREVVSESQERVEGSSDFVLDDAGSKTEIVDGYTVTCGNKVLDYKKTARSIPESLRVITLLKQYFQPKLNGIVVSRKDLDEERMKPFWEAGLDNVHVFMKVEEGEKERYYSIAKDKSVLMNLRNRYIHGHPKFIVVLPNEFQHWQQLSEMEAQELQDLRSQKHREERQNNPRGRGRGDRNHRGGNRGRGRGGFGGYRDNQNDRGGFRGGNRGGFRGGRGNFGRNDRGRGRRNDRDRGLDLEDIFSPNPRNYHVERPNFGSTDTDNGMSGWASAVAKRYQSPKKPQQE